MAEKKSFRDTILIVFVVLVCFGLTIYGIVFLMGATKVSAPDAPETITNQFVTPKVITDPNDGSVMNFTDNATTEGVDNKPTAVVPAPAPTKAVEPATKPAEKKAATKPVEKKATPKAEPKKETAKPVEKKAAPKAEPKKETAVAPAEKPAVDNDDDETPAPVAQTSGKFVLQLMALRSEPDAYAAMNKYKNICPDITVTRVEIKDNGVWYRVRCGVTDSMDEALVLKQKFATDFKINADIIKNQK